MPSFFRLLVLFVTCLGLVGAPLPGNTSCCPDDEEAVTASGDRTDDGEAECVVSAVDDHPDDAAADACRSGCGCCHPAAILTKDVDGAVCVTVGPEHPLATQRAPPPPGPEGRRKVPRTT